MLYSVKYFISFVTKIYPFKKHWLCIIIESLVLFGICQLVRISQSNQFFSLHQFHTWVSPGGGMSWRSHSPTPENGEIIFYYIGAFLILFFHYRRLFSLFKGLFGYFFLLGGGGGFFIHVGGPFAIFFSIWGGLFFYLKILFGLMRGGHFWGLPNPPPPLSTYKHFCGRPWFYMCRCNLST